MTTSTRIRQQHKRVGRELSPLINVLCILIVVPLLAVISRFLRSEWAVYASAVVLSIVGSAVHPGPLFGG